MSTGASAEPTSKPQRIQRTARRLNRDKAIALRAKGVPIRDIAQLQGVNPSTIVRFFQGNMEAKESLAFYKAHRSDVFAEIQVKGIRVQSQVLDSLLKDRVLDALQPHQKASILQSVNVVIGTIYDKERLELGKSTSNVGVLQRIMGSALSAAHKAEETKPDPTPIEGER